LNHHGAESVHIAHRWRKSSPWITKLSLARRTTQRSIQENAIASTSEELYKETAHIVQTTGWTLEAIKNHRRQVF